MGLIMCEDVPVTKIQNEIIDRLFSGWRIKRECYAGDKADRFFIFAGNCKGCTCNRCGDRIATQTINQLTKKGFLNKDLKSTQLGLYL